MKDFDLVLFGATGFTGRLVADYLAAAPKREGRSSTGRSPGATSTSSRRSRSSSITSRSLIADALDPAACRAIAERTRTVCTTVGPYAKYGSALVAACADAGTHYCDLTGEVNWMRAMIDAHHERAAETGARIVHACGFDSIPSDLGTWAAQQEHIRAATAARATRVTARVRRVKRRHVGRHRRERLHARRGDERSGGAPRPAQPATRSIPIPTAPHAPAPDNKRPGWDARLEDVHRSVLHGRHELAGRAARPRARRLSVGRRLRVSRGDVDAGQRARARDGRRDHRGLVGLAAAMKRPRVRELLQKRAPKPGEGPDRRRRATPGTGRSGSSPRRRRAALRRRRSGRRSGLRVDVEDARRVGAVPRVRRADVAGRRA